MNKIFYEKPQPLPKREQKNSINKTDFVDRKETAPKFEKMDIEETYYQPSYHANDYLEEANTSPTKRNIKELVAKGILIVLSIGLVVNICIAIDVINDMNYSYTKDEDDFWYSIDEGDYAPLIMNVWNNRFNSVKETDGLEQCYAVAEYFEAASLYKVADYTGNTEKKEKYAGIMEEKLDYFDDIMYIAEDINMKLGIE